MVEIRTRRMAAAAAMTLGLVTGGAGTAQAAGATPAAGEFRTAITAVAPEERGANCLLTVTGTLTFLPGGTLEGVATGTTTALVHASCPDVFANPLGTFSDVFTFRGEFEGTVNGTPVEDDLVYAGASRPPGDITATIRIGRGATARLQADATVGVGGTYTGIVRG